MPLISSLDIHIEDSFEFNLSNGEKCLDVIRSKLASKREKGINFMSAIKYIDESV